MPFNCGINESIFAHHEKCVSKVKPINKICILMFDEIALSPGLQHNSRTDSIEGFLDYGSSNCRLAFADHALTFIMLKGIHKNGNKLFALRFVKEQLPPINWRAF
jgi:hypothetical protein